MKFTRLLKNSIGAAVLAGVLFIVPAKAHAGVFVSVAVAPPAIPVYEQPVAPGDGYLRNTIAPSWGYGYQVWILPGERRMFALLGRFGQDIFVDPESKLVMVQTAVRTEDRGRHDRDPPRCKVAQTSLLPNKETVPSEECSWRSSRVAPDLRHWPRAD